VRRYDEPSTADNLGTETDAAVHQKLHYHRVGTDQSQDVCLFAMPDHPTWMCSATVSSDGRWLWLSIGDGCEPANKAYVCDLAALPRAADSDSIGFQKVSFDTAAGAPRLPVVKLADDFSASWGLVAVDGTVLTVQTNAGAPRERLVAVDMAGASDGALAKGRFREVLPQHPKDLLQVRRLMRTRGCAMFAWWLDWKHGGVPWHCVLAATQHSQSTSRRRRGADGRVLRGSLGNQAPGRCI
jgi:prolyl oligopeptidase